MRSLISTLPVLLLLGLAAQPSAVTVQGASDSVTFDGYSPAASAAEQKAEDALRAVPDPERMRADMRRLSLEPHALSQPYDHDNAEWILAQFKADGLDARIETFHVLFPTPKTRELELTAPTVYKAKLKEPPVDGDPTSRAAGQLPPYNAYSIDGDVTAPLVFVNYGVPADYDELAKLDIDVRGKIVLAKYGHGWRGVKPKVAAEHGAVGCIIYSEPHDDGYFRGDIFPEGPYRPWDGVQRGSVMDISQGEGDPSTPGLALGDLDAPRLPVDQIKTLTKIPTLPISYGDALPLLEALRGPVAPTNWRGALPTTYHVGPGPATVHLEVAFNWDIVPLYDVIAEIPGSEFPDQWIIRANHHDAWVFGASDPLSGTVPMLEEARAFGTLLKQGWQPRRTIILAAWDGEEPMTLGSTAWAFHHAPELKEKAVAYLNSDNTSKGYLRVQASHTLEHFFNGVAKAVKDPGKDQTLWDAIKAAALERAKGQEKEKIASRPDLRVGALGSGSDWAAFLDNLGIASADLRFVGGGGGGGVYHSAYDDFYWFTHFSDTDFKYERAFAQVMGTAVMRLADAQVLPFEFTDFADTIALYIQQLQELHDGTGGAPALDFGPLTSAQQRLATAATAYNAAYNRAAGSGDIFKEDRARLAELNRLLYQSERKMTVPDGLPGRPWYKHAIYAPGTYTGYGVKTLPSVREAIEQGHWQEATEQITAVAGVLDAVTAQITAATSELGGSSLKAQ